MNLATRPYQGMLRIALAPVVVMIGAGCASPYGERAPRVQAPPPAESGDPHDSDRVIFLETATQDTTRHDGEPRTVVGSVSPDGALQADTLTGVHPDTSRVERETVVTGTLRRAPDSSSDRLVRGFRVQVFASEDRTAATDVARRLERQLVVEPIYVEWIPPWYKVRVGDFTTRAAVDRLRERLADLGYPTAWAVQTTIRTAP